MPTKLCGEESHRKDLQLRNATPIGGKLEDYRGSLSTQTFSGNSRRTDLQLLPEVLHNGFRPGTDVEFFVDAAKVTPDCFDTYKKCIRDLLIPEPFGKVR